MLNAGDEYDGETMPAYRALAKLFADDLPALQKAIETRPAPMRQVMVTLHTEGCDPLIRLEVQTEWAVHRARMEAWLVNDSYSFTDSDFKDSIATPSIDTWNPEPGPGWEPIKADTITGSSMFRFYKMLGDIGPPSRQWPAMRTTKRRRQMHVRCELGVRRNAYPSRNGEVGQRSPAFNTTGEALGPAVPKLRKAHQLHTANTCVGKRTPASS